MPTKQESDETKATIDEITQNRKDGSIKVKVTFEIAGAGERTQTFDANSVNELETVIPDTIKTELKRLSDLARSYESAVKTMVGGYYKLDGSFVSKK